jgi:hypothetical protein
MILTELVKWRKEHPTDPLYQCANIGGTVHLVNHCGTNKFGTSCGLKGSTPQQVIVFLLPTHMVTCPQCSNGGK